MGKGYGLEVKKCKECGKVFCPPFPELWAYKRSFRWYCSYGCMRKAQVRETPKVKKTQGFAPRKRVEAIDAETGQVVAEWETMTQCVREVPFTSMHKLQKLVESGEPFEGRIYKARQISQLGKHATRSKEVVVIDANSGAVVAEYPALRICAEAVGLTAASSIYDRITSGKAYNGRIYKLKKDYLEGK